MGARKYNGGAAATTLASGITSGDTSISVTDASTWPATGAFSIVLARGLAGEEKILIASRSGNTLTATTRGYDGTSATAHLAGVTAECCGTATDFQEANDHVNASSGVHGLSGAVVGTTDTQTLTNKTLTSPVLNTPTVNTPTVNTPTVASPTFTGTATTPANYFAESNVASLTTDLTNRVKVLNVGNPIVGAAPTVATTQFYAQMGTAVITYSSGGSTITYPTAFTTGVVAVLATLGDGSAVVVVPQHSSDTVAHFVVKVFDMAGAEVGAGGNYRINWLAYGW